MHVPSVPRVRRAGSWFAMLALACAALATGSAAGVTPAAEASIGNQGVPSLRAQGAVAVPTHPVGLGAVVSSKDGGQIFGWDIDEHGTDGVLATSQTTADPGVYRVSVETFDQSTGKVVRSFARTTNDRDSYTVDGIFTGDVALVTHFVVPKGSIFAKRRYDVMNPVTADRFTGAWMPPVKDIDVVARADNQHTATSVMYAIELKDQDNPDVIVTDLRGGGSKAIPLDPALFGLANGPKIAQDTSTHRAVLALSPDGGAVFGLPPRIALVNLRNGHVETFSGPNQGFFHAGFVNGLAVDSSTRAAATTTELNAQVEFYDLAAHTSTVAQLPGTTDTDQLHSGAAIASDPVHGLFLVAVPTFAPTGDSAIVVYDEDGNLVESIPGFHFSDASAVIPVRVAVNPALRMGWVDGPGINQLQQFFY